MDRIQLRRDTSARWAEINPILLEGEVGYEIDTKLRKIGDGVNRWNDLEYLRAEGITQETGDSENATMSQKAITRELSELGSEVELGNLIRGWYDMQNHDGAIAGTGLVFNLDGYYKAIPVKEGDKIEVSAGEYGGYMAVVTRLPQGSEIPYVDGEQRWLVDANQTRSFFIPANSKFLLIEAYRNTGDTKPNQVLINGKSIMFSGNSLMPFIVDSTLKQGLFTIPYWAKVNITNDEIIIPSGSRVVYSGKTYFQTTSEVRLSRSGTATVEFVMFDIESKTFSIQEYGHIDVSSPKLIFCFYVLYSLYGASLNPQMYTLNGEDISDNSYFLKKGEIIPPNDSKIIVKDDVIIIPAATRLYYGKNKVYRKYEDITINRAATSSSTYSEEVLVFNPLTEVFQCVGGGEFANIDRNSILIAGFKKGFGGTTLSDDVVSANKIAVLAVKYYAKVNITKSNIVIPAGSRVYYNNDAYYQISSDIVLEREEGAQQQFVLFDFVTKQITLASAGAWKGRALSTYPLFWVSYDNCCSLSVSLYTVEGKPIYELEGISKTGILDFNPKVEVESKLIPQTAYKSNTLLTLLHFSDLHSSSVNLQRIVEFRNEYSGYIDDSIHTGDTVNGIITDPNPFETVVGAENILNVIGNHEAWLSYDIPDYTATEKQCYDKIFAPSISNWGVTQPENAESDGKCYYYKDYVDANIRLIVLDSVHWHTRNAISDDASVQKAWFVNVLSDARGKGMTVVAAIHYPPLNGIDLVKKTGFTRYSKNDTEIWGDGWYASDEIFGCVDNFISSGGKFATWLVGHTHYDICGQVHGHEGQFMVVIQSCTRSWDENHLVEGTKTQDAFNVITIEPSNTTVKITRIGNDTDSYMQSKKTLCYDYGSKELIYNT